MADVKWIYVYRTNRGKDLYIGQTNNVIGRFKQHCCENKMFKLVDKIYCFELPDGFTKTQAEIIESILIMARKPVANRTRRKYVEIDTDTINAFDVFFSVFKDVKSFEDFLNDYCYELDAKDFIDKR